VFTQAVTTLWHGAHMGHTRSHTTEPTTVRRRGRASLGALVVVAMVAGACSSSKHHGAVSPSSSAGQPPTSQQAHADPSTTLPSGRLVAPAGRRVDLGDFPVGLALSPDGSLAVAPNSGQGSGVNGGNGSFCDDKNGAANRCHQAPAALTGDPATPAPDESLSVVDLAAGRATDVTATPTSHDPAHPRFNFFAMGVAFSPDGHHLYATGGGNDAVYDFAVSGGSVVTPPASTAFLTPEGKPPVAGARSDFFRPAPGDAAETKGLAITPDGAHLLVTKELTDELDVLRPDLSVEARLALGPPGPGAYPYAVAVSPDGARAWVSLQGTSSLAVVGLAQGAPSLITTVAVGDHPTGLAVTPDGRQVLVANANDDTLTVVDAQASTVVAHLDLHAIPGEPWGSVPNAVAVAKDGRRAYVALAGDDALAVLDRAGPDAPWAVSGFVPTGWYPTAVAVRPSDGAVVAVASKGLGSRYVAGGAYPPLDPSLSSPSAVPTSYYYDGNNMPGLMTVLAAPTAGTLAESTKVVVDGLQAAGQVDTRSPSNPVPAKLGDPSPIKHVLYIVRENRTFDQVFGDLRRTRQDVNADPSFELLAAATPNAHAVASRYAISDSFFSDGEASVQGHFWTSSANVDDYTEKAWRQYYSPRNHPTDTIDVAAEPKGCSLFQAAMTRRAQTNGAFTWRDFGEPVGLANPADTFERAGSKLKAGQVEHCAGVQPADIDLSYYVDGFDQDNRKDANRFLTDVGLDASGQQVGDPSAHFLRNFNYLVLPGDHTTGYDPTKNTPRSEVAQNDAGLGAILASVSRSRYWKDTAVFVVEDDSQDGPDHVDGHRNILLVASPWARQLGKDGHTPGYVSQVHHDQAGVLHTMELILGLPPLSSYDAGASPIYDLFGDVNDPAALPAQASAPFVVAPAPSFIDEKVASLTGAQPAALRAATSRLDVSAVDRAGPGLEAVLWQSVRPNDPLPVELRRRLGQPAPLPWAPPAEG